MNNEALKTHAELLNNAINVFKGESADVAFLSTYRPLLAAIDDAIHERIDGIRDLGLSRWELESSIRDIPEVSKRLAQFELLLEGEYLRDTN